MQSQCVLKIGELTVRRTSSFIKIKKPWVNYPHTTPPLYFYFRDLLACTTGLIVSRDNQTTKPWSFSARTGIHELYILLAKPFEIPNLRAKSLNSQFNFSFINTRNNWSETSSWKENVFSIFNSLTKVNNISFVTQVYNKLRAAIRKDEIL
jgi:hypothetical protein